MPALLTRTSIPPRAVLATSTPRVTSYSSRTSMAIPTAPEPSRAAAASARSVSRPVTTTRAPASSRAAAIASPRPLVPPVIRTRTPSARVFGSLTRPTLGARPRLRSGGTGRSPGRRPPSSSGLDDRGDRAAAGGPLVHRGHRDEDGRVAGHRRGDTTDGRLDLPVPEDVGVVQHRVAPAAHVPGRVGLALEEDVDQPAVEVRVVRALGELEAGVPDRVPDAVLVQRVVHHR